MIDAYLRGPKEVVLGPIARRAPRAVHPIAITLAAVVPGIGSVLAAATGHNEMAVSLWLVNRALDGFDGLFSDFVSVGAQC